MFPPAQILRHHLGFGALILWLLIALAPRSVHAQDNPAVQAVVQAINQQRANAGLAPLTVHPLLNQAAQGHVNDMIANGAYGHMGSDGSYVRQRVQRVGYSAGGWASENWVSATGTEGAMAWWMNDWIHRENILNARWQEFGVGVGTAPSGRMIFVTVFTAGADNGDGEVAPVFEALPVDGADYTIRPGDTLIAIAARYGLDWTMIAEANRLTDYTLLQIGQVIRLPGVQNIGGAVEQPAVKTQFLPGAGEPYSVKPGDTLLSIAVRHGLSWQELAAANGLGEHELLQIGQIVTIPGEPKVELASMPQPLVMTLPVTSVSPASSARTHTVVPGETLLSIAIEYDLTWKGLADANHLTERDLLQINQVLIIPEPANTPPAQTLVASAATTGLQPISPQLHTVASGETIVTIAVRYGLNWQQLLTLNGLSESSVLQVGQQIRLH